MSRKIAIVEDEAELAALIEYNLARSGFQSRIFGGEEGTLAALEAFGPDLIVLDVMLPTDHQPPRIVKPGEQAFDLPTPLRTAQWASVLRGRFARGAVKGNDFDPPVGHERLIEPIAVGDVLSPMPLFLRPGAYVLVPLEETYQAAWEGVPRRWRRVIERP